MIPFLLALTGGVVRSKHRRGVFRYTDNATGTVKQAQTLKNCQHMTAGLQSFADHGVSDAVSMIISTGRRRLIWSRFREVPRNLTACLGIFMEAHEHFEQFQEDFVKSLVAGNLVG